MKKVFIKYHFIIIGLILAIVVLLAGGYYQDSKSVKDSSNMNEKTEGVVRFMPVGDSYTIGNGVKAAERWPNLLVKSLEKEGIEVELISNPSVTGYDAGDALEREMPLFEKEKPDFGTLFIGANDSFRGRDLEVFKNDYVELLDRMQNALTDRDNLVVITVPNYATFPGVKGYSITIEDIEGYNRIIREEAQKRDLKIVDLYKVNQLVGEEFFIPDGIHPSPKGIKIWHDAIFPVVRDALK